MNKALPLAIDPQNVPLAELKKQARQVKKPRKQTNPADKLKIRDVKTGKTQKQQESNDKAARSKVFGSLSDLIDQESKSRNALPLNSGINFQKTYQTMSNASLNNGMSIGYESEPSDTEVFKYNIKKSSSDDELTDARKKKKQDYNRTYRTRAQLKKLIDIPTLEQTLEQTLEGGQEESKEDMIVNTPPATPKRKGITSTKKKKSMNTKSKK